MSHPYPVTYWDPRNPYVFQHVFQPANTTNQLYFWETPCDPSYDQRFRVSYVPIMPPVVTREPPSHLAKQNEKIEAFIEKLKLFCSCFPSDEWPVTYSNPNSPKPSPWPLNSPTKPSPPNSAKRCKDHKLNLLPNKRCKSTGTSL